MVLYTPYSDPNRMALSVLAFPEPSCHTAVYMYGKSTFMSSPRSHGLSSANNKKPHPTTMSKSDETEFPSTITTPPTNLLILPVRTIFLVRI